MARPLTVTISHELGREGAKRRIADGMGHIRTQLTGIALALDERWTGDQLSFRLLALGQTVTGRIEVEETLVRLEIMLPGLLGAFAQRIAGRIRLQGAKLLGPKRE